MISLGLCCMFHSVPHIKYRTTTATHNAKMDTAARLDKLSELCLHNAEAVLESLIYCADNGIRSFRLSSDLFPIKTHPELGYRLDALPGYDEIIAAYELCRELAHQYGIRLGLHPDQFVVLSSPHERVVTASIRELEHHNEIAEIIGADTINIHAGGVYGDKKSALDRLRSNLALLSPSLRDKITLENDDKSYTVADLLPLCTSEGVPIVYDVHHHRCLPDELSIIEATDQVFKTWGNREPLFHISSSKSADKIRDHADYIEPSDFPQYWREVDRPITVEVEAKLKELAVSHLAESLRNQT